MTDNKYDDYFAERDRLESLRVEQVAKERCFKTYESLRNISGTNQQSHDLNNHLNNILSRIIGSTRLDWVDRLRLAGNVQSLALVLRSI